MKSKEFGAWPLRNVSSGGQQSSFDEYNRHLKGKSYQSYEEYASRRVEEYHHYPEQKDMTTDQDERQDADRDRKEKNTKSRRMQMIQQVVVLAVGSVMIVSSYQARINQQAPTKASDPTVDVVATEPADPGLDPDNNADAPTEDVTEPTQPVTEPTEGETGADATQSDATQSGATSPTQGGSGGSSGRDTQSATDAPAGTSISWSWSSDGSAASLVITDSSGRALSTTTATVTTSQTPASCRTGGRITRTASAQADGRTYTDTQYEDTPALGHSFDSGTEVVLDDGQTAMDFECARCHEHFVIKNSVTEE